MKNSLFGLLIIFTMFTHLQPLHSWEEIERYEVGKQPVLFYPHDQEESLIQSVFCLGYDANFNGVYEPELGDEYPSWWRTDAILVNLPKIPKINASNGSKLRDFEFASLKFPFRPGIDEDQEKLYLNQNGKIVIYNLETGEILDSNFAEFDPIAISVSEDRLFLSIRVDIGNDYTIDSNYVLILDKASGTVVDKIETEDMVQQTLHISNKLIILCEGLNRVDDSKIMIVDISNTQHEVLHTITVGGGGNHIYQRYNNSLIVTLNGSHEVKLISLDDYEVISTVKIPTEGYDGPRETTYDEDWDQNYHTSAYNGKVYEIDFKSSSVIDSLSCAGKVEGLYINHYGFLVVTNPNSIGSYVPDSLVVVYSVYSSINDPSPKVHGSIFPNPVSNIAKVEFDMNRSVFEEVSVEIVDLLGNSIQLGKYFPVDGIISFELNVEDINLASGQYFLLAKSLSSMKSIPITVVR